MQKSEKEVWQFLIFLFVILLLCEVMMLLLGNIGFWLWLFGGLILLGYCCSKQ